MAVRAAVDAKVVEARCFAVVPFNMLASCVEAKKAGQLRTGGSGRSERPTLVLLGRRKAIENGHGTGARGLCMLLFAATWLHHANAHGNSNMLPSMLFPNPLVAVPISRRRPASCNFPRT